MIGLEIGGDRHGSTIALFGAFTPFLNGFRGGAVFVSFNWGARPLGAAITQHPGH